ncbi:acyl-CoA dehydrogenase family protein [Wenjunlia tyrosinilytica]|uniref:Acyl-CoA dehydrogenase n=1 Tax=Wenjunlia tyrosinilytica TaxID=1544741 RepID=A0A918DVY4_9ACTN|nr:acyl-CoA dehydrogenase family protein [Wenjunlia tyrosinilytica]GGO86761.1 acyl-CoA dehydrogenase [Wenjunlia tyrosinilytica]
MDAEFTAEQDGIRRALRDLLTKRCGPGEVKAAVRTDAGYDEGLWERLAGAMGLPGLALPTEYGGVGCSMTELALACEETGRALLPSPLLATALLAAPVVAALGGDHQRNGILPRLASGELTAALALPGAPGAALGLVPGGCEAGGGRAGGVQARREGDGWLLYGQVDQVLDGHRAGLLVVAAHTGGYTRGRTLLFLVDGAAEGLSRVRSATLDETRAQARVELREVPAVLLGHDGADVAEALRRTGDAAAAALAAEAVGAADRALANTVAYVRVREQFGRPVGSFQAVKHRLADLYVRVQAARSAAYYAAWAAGEEPEELRTAGPLALAQALEASRAAAGEGIQLHGGVGFTWEHDAHLYFKRAAADELLFGPVHQLRATAAERAGVFRRGERGERGERAEGSERGELGERGERTEMEAIG